MEKPVFKPSKKLRGLDIDDLYLCYYLHYGYRPSEISRLLNLTQPAICSRRHKIKDITGVMLYPLNAGPKTFRMNTEGAKLCAEIARAIEILSQHLGGLLPVGQVPAPKSKKSNDAQGFLGAV